MALTEKKHHRGRRVRKRTFGKRRRTGFFVFVGLVVLVLGALALFGTGRALQQEAASVSRVAGPTAEEAPEAVSEEPAVEEEQAAQEEPTTQEPAVEEEEEAAPPPPGDPTMFLTVPKLGVYGHTVRNDNSEEALDLGAIKLPGTGFPWEEGSNTYIAGHRIGWPWNETYYQFYKLPSLQQGDEVFLTDANGTVYEYRVSEMFAVSPSDTWVTEPIAGRDVVSLQTCTETPDDWWTIGPRLMESGPQSGRLIVRADRVA